MSDEVEQKVDHIGKADHSFEVRRWLDAAEREAVIEERDPQIATAFAVIAHAHAQIAIAEQLERLNQQLSAVSSVDAKEPFGSKRKYVRTGR